MVKRAWSLPMRRASAAVLGDDTLPIAAIAEAERLVGLGFRYWLNGFRTGDIGCWEKAWDAYAGSLGPTLAKGAVTDLARWVRSIDRHAQRRPETLATDCDCFCRDECVAIAMIAACQHNACPAMRACAFSLLGCSLIEDVVSGATSFAATMRGAKQVLPPCYTTDACLLAMAPATAARQ
jgi:hypothetical protein